MHHIFINENQIIDKSILINHKDDFLNYNHLRNALRIKINEKVLISINNNKLSNDYISEVSKITNDDIKLNITEECPKNELDIKIVLYQGLPKFDKLEYIIEKAVELGVDTIIPVKMQTCVVKVDDKKIQSKVDRWSKISLSAATQSKRGVIPIVKSPISFDEMINQIKDDKNSFVLYENSKSETIKNLDILKNIDNNVNIVVGPEGGFSDKEIKLVTDNNIKLLSLGRRILRTETAGLAIMSYIMLNAEYNKN